MQHTVVINAVNEAHSNLGMVVSHQDDVKQLLAVWVELPQSRVDSHQGLCERTDTEGQGVLSERWQDKHYNIWTTCLNNTETICMQISETEYTPSVCVAYKWAFITVFKKNKTKPYCREEKEWWWNGNNHHAPVSHWSLYTWHPSRFTVAGRRNPNEA